MVAVPEQKCANEGIVSFFPDLATPAVGYAVPGDAALQSASCVMPHTTQKFLVAAQPTVVEFIAQQE